MTRCSAQSALGHHADDLQRGLDNRTWYFVTVFVVNALYVELAEQGATKMEMKWKDGDLKQRRARARRMLSEYLHALYPHRLSVPLIPYAPPLFYHLLG